MRGLEKSSEIKIVDRSLFLTEVVRELSRTSLREVADAGHQERRRMVISASSSCFKGSNERPWNIQSRALLLDRISSTMQSIISLTDYLKKEEGGMILSIVMEFLRSPKIVELATSDPSRFTIEDDSTLKYTHPGFTKVEISLKCPICLDIFYKPVALTCGHIYCHCCAKDAKAIDSRCPVCRRDCTHNDATPMKKLSSMLKVRFRKYWDQRASLEREHQKQQLRERESQYIRVP